MADGEGFVPSDEIQLSLQLSSVAVEEYEACMASGDEEGARRAALMSLDLIGPARRKVLDFLGYKQEGDI